MEKYEKQQEHIEEISKLTSQVRDELIDQTEKNLTEESGRDFVVEVFWKSFAAIKDFEKKKFAVAGLIEFLAAQVTDEFKSKITKMPYSKVCQFLTH